MKERKGKNRGSGKAFLSERISNTRYLKQKMISHIKGVKSLRIFRSIEDKQNKERLQLKKLKID